MSDQQAPGPPTPPFVPGHLGAPSRSTLLNVSAVVGALASIERCGGPDVKDVTRGVLTQAERAGLRVSYSNRIGPDGPRATELWVCRDHGRVLHVDAECPDCVREGGPM